MGRRSFSREFKLEAVRLVRERGVSVAQAARDLDLHHYFDDGGRPLGPWEEDELSYAEAARHSNMLRLAIVCVAKALEVSTLSPQEYDEGYNYGRRRAS